MHAMTVCGVFAIAGILVLELSVLPPAGSLSAYTTDHENLQNIPLLQGSRNSTPEGPVGEGGVAVVDGSVLRAIGGPSDDGEEVLPENGAISVYIVKEGDSLSEIADMFGVSMNTIVWANDLGEKKIITPGQKLVILPVSGVRYTIKKGDTLSSIAKAFKGDENEIKQYNDIYNDNALVVGETIVIPGGDMTRDHAPKSSTQPSQTSPAPSRPAPSSQPTYAGFYRHPIPSAVKTQGIHGYNAIDLAAPVGTPIMATAGGTVIISRQNGWNGGYGNYVVIRHSNGTQSLYAHNSRNAVGVGQTVVQGQVIAYIGSTGNSTGPHVHFEIRGASNPF